MAAAKWHWVWVTIALIGGAVGLQQTYRKVASDAQIAADLAAAKAALAQAKVDELEQTNLVLYSLREAANVGYLQLDDQCRVQVWNATMARWSGRTEEEMLGQTLEKAISPNSWAKYDADYADWINVARDRSAAGKPLVGTLIVNCDIIPADPSKKPIPVRVTARAVFANNTLRMIGLVDRQRNVRDLTQTSEP